jgi:diguanylate cyclase (GGDEF)-like protein
MNALQTRVDEVPLKHNNFDDISLELEHYRRKAARLQKINDLYRKLAGITDMPSMIESYSIWLSQYVPHEIIGYNNLTRQRMHMFCSCHGPHRRQIISIADTILRRDRQYRESHPVIEGFHSHAWSFKDADNAALLILLRKDQPIPQEQIELINDSLTILAKPLAKTHNFEEMYKQARMDTLTGLPNRLVFEERIDSIIEHARRHKTPLTLAALDLDHFKAVNDTMGHLYGDEVLQRVASALHQQVRLTDLLVRMGGDELLVVLTDTDIQAARSLCRRLCQAVADLNIMAGREQLAMSIGLTQWQKGMKKKEWLEKADDTLYQAKKGGRNQIAG